MASKHFDEHIASRKAAEQAARDAYSRANDEWASAEYRMETAAVLARRCLQRVEG